MSDKDAFDAILASLHKAMLDDAHWPATFHLIDDLCGMTGNGLVVAEGSGDDAKLVFGRYYSHGQRREDLEREYYEVYYPHDERGLRLMELSDGTLVHVPELYTEQELKTSATYNEYLLRVGGQNGLNACLDGPQRSRIVWVMADPVAGGGWGSAQVEMIERLLPHIRRFVHVRQAVGQCRCPGRFPLPSCSTPPVSPCSTSTGAGASSRPTILPAASCGAAMACSTGAVPWAPGCRPTTARLQLLLAAAIPPFGGQAVSGSMTIGLASGPPNLVLHVIPVGDLEQGFGLRRVAALVVAVDPQSRSQIDPGLVASALGLTPGESRVVASLTEGRSIRDIAAATNRQENTVYKHLKQVYRKLGISRQTDLVRLVLRLAAFSRWRRSRD